MILTRDIPEREQRWGDGELAVGLSKRGGLPVYHTFASNLRETFVTMRQNCWLPNLYQQINIGILNHIQIINYWMVPRCVEHIKMQYPFLALELMNSW